jgi:xylulokinase
MFLGIDLGTSSLKAIVLDRHHRVRASASVSLTVSQPHPLWREQDPRDWWQACREALQAVLSSARKEGIPGDAIEAIGLTGQMHGAILLDAQDRVLRPAILWNDGRAFEECAELEQRVPQARAITGNLMMPGFTAPKLAWVAKHEPKVFELIAKILLPKDYLRLCLTGDYASDMSDAAGMLLMNVGTRQWSEPLLAALALSTSQLPKLYEGPQITGHLRRDVAASLGLQAIPVVAGAGDNAAGAVGMGVTQPGQAMLSLGSSGVYFVATQGFQGNPAQAVHSFCHALPNTWHLMSVMLSAAACLDHTATLTGAANVQSLLSNAEQRAFSSSTPMFLPYLNGERTPHNNPLAKAGFFDIDASCNSADLANATLEGVAQGLHEGMQALEATGVHASSISLIGGGSRSPYWAQILADVCQRSLLVRDGGDVGPALGAARLAWLGQEGGRMDALPDICPQPKLIAQYAPRADRSEFFAGRGQRFKDLYRRLYG